MRHPFAPLTVVAGGLLAIASAGAQQPRAMAGMMGMHRDSATMAQMAVIHELMAKHDHITRTVTNLPNGIRAVTESDDARLVRLIQEHVASMDQRLKQHDDPGLPIETPAVHTLFRNADKIKTTTRTTAHGVLVEQTSTDSTVVAALQQHAREVSDLVQGGMTALHAAMMKNMGMMQHTMPADTGARHAGHEMGQSDSAFAALQERGKRAMGVDQYTSTHHFDDLSDGGRIELQSDTDDTASVTQIRRHLQEIAKAFAAGDFSTPAFVHAQEVPGTKVMAARRSAITYTYHALPRGGEVRIATSDAEAVAAIHDFLAFQRQDHRAAGKHHRAMPHPPAP